MTFKEEQPPFIEYLTEFVLSDDADEAENQRQMDEARKFIFRHEFSLNEVSIGC